MATRTKRYNSLVRQLAQTPYFETSAKQKTDCKNAGYSKWYLRNLQIDEEISVLKKEIQTLKKYL